MPVRYLHTFAQPFKFKVVLELKDWTDAYQWIKRNQPLIKVHISQDDKLYYVGSKANPIITEESVRVWMGIHLGCKWVTFDELRKQEDRMYCIHLNRENYMKGKCSCVWFSKHYMCKHVIGVSKRPNIPKCEITLQAKNISIGSNRKAGCPAVVPRNQALLIN